MNTTNRQQQIETYILNCIDGEGYGRELTTDTEKLQFLHDTFMSEYGWALDRMSKFVAFREWLQGLPSSFNIAFSYFDISNICTEWGILKAGSSEIYKDHILSSWFTRIATEAMILMKDKGIIDSL